MDRRAENSIVRETQWGSFRLLWVKLLPAAGSGRLRSSVGSEFRIRGSFGRNVSSKSSQRK